MKFRLDNTSNYEARPCVNCLAVVPANTLHECPVFEAQTDDEPLFEIVGWGLYSGEADELYWQDEPGEEEEKDG